MYVCMQLLAAQGTWSYVDGSQPTCPDCRMAMDSRNPSFDIAALVPGLVRNGFEPSRAEIAAQALARIEATTERLFAERLPDLLELAGNHRLLLRALACAHQDAIRGAGPPLVT